MATATIKNPDGTFTIALTAAQKTDLKTDLANIATELRAIADRIDQAVA